MRIARHIPMTLHRAGIVLALGIIGGCQTPPAAPRIERPVDSRTLLEKYNQRTRRIQQLWVSAVVELNWTDAKGNHFEQGNGPLIIRKPDDLALAIGKLGQIVMYLGSNGERFWLFELQPPKGQPTIVHIGRNEDVGAANMPALPIPIGPDRLIQLLGVNPIPSGEGQPAVLVEKDDSGSVVFRYPVAAERADRHWRVTVDSTTALPVKIVLLDAFGEPMIESHLSEYKSLRIDGAPPGAWPDVATRVQIELKDRQATVTLYLRDDLSDGRAEGRVHDAQFDFEKLVNRYRPQQVNVLEPRP